MITHGIFFDVLRNMEIGGFESWLMFRFNLIKQLQHFLTED